MRTQRHKLIKSTNIFMILPELTCNNEKAFDLVVDVFTEQTAEFTSRFITTLDDMNLRGEQIEIALEFAKSPAKLMELVKRRDKALVEYVNANYAGSDIEEAVERGAAKHGHLDRPKVKLQSALPRAVVLD